MRLFALERRLVSNHRVLIVSDQPLFAQGVRTLVETRTRAEVIGTESYGVNILDCATRLQPDIIILGADRDAPPSLPLALLDISPNVRVIRLSLDGNVMHVYDGHRLAANSAEDLASSVDTFTEASLITP
jgi:DNA-binding NarL/FixJ family response regulator